MAAEDLQKWLPELYARWKPKLEIVPPRVWLSQLFMANLTSYC